MIGEGKQHSRYEIRLGRKRRPRKKYVCSGKMLVWLPIATGEM